MMNKTKIKQLVKETLEATLNEEVELAEGGTLQNTAKGAAMALLDAAKVMEQSPSHEPASRYAQAVAKQANLIMDMLVQMEDDEAGRNPGGSIGEGLQEAGSLGAGRTIEEVWQSLQDNAFQAHKDLQMLAIHLGNAKYTTKEVDDAVDTLERMLNMLNQDVVSDVRKMAEK